MLILREKKAVTKQVKLWYISKPNKYCIKTQRCLIFINIDIQITSVLKMNMLVLLKKTYPQGSFINSLHLLLLPMTIGK